MDMYVLIYFVVSRVSGLYKVLSFHIQILQMMDNMHIDKYLNGFL